MEQTIQKLEKAVRAAQEIMGTEYGLVLMVCPWTETDTELAANKGAYISNVPKIIGEAMMEEQLRQLKAPQNIKVHMPDPDPETN